MGLFTGKRGSGLKLSVCKRASYLVKRKPCVLSPRKSPCHKRPKLTPTSQSKSRKEKHTTPVKSSRKQITFLKDKENEIPHIFTENENYFKMPQEIRDDLQWVDAAIVDDLDNSILEQCDMFDNTCTSIPDERDLLDNIPIRHECDVIDHTPILDERVILDYTPINDARDIIDNNPTAESAEKLMSLLPGVITEFRNNGKLDILEKFFQLVKEKKFPMKNITFLLWCDIVNWFDKTDTRQMRYSPECLQFFWVGKKLFGGRFIRFMSGMKSEAEILKGNSVLSPHNAKVNCACPSISVLNSINPLGDELPLTYKPGILEPMIEFKSKHADKDNSYVLMMDGKKIKRGTDVDLLGFENENNLQERLNEKEVGLGIVKHSIDVITKTQDKSNTFSDTDDTDKSEIIPLLLGIVLLLSSVLRGLRKLKLKKNYALSKLKKQGGVDWRKSKYAYSIDMCLTIIWKISNIIDKSLKVLTCICKAGAHLNKVSHLFADKKCINLNKQENLRILKQPDKLPTGTEMTNTSVIKQRSPIWFEERKHMKVTGSTIYKALGCDGLKRQKEHYDKVINNIDPPEFSENQKIAMQHGTESEPHQIATMTGIIMPFLYPDLLFREEGYYFHRNTMVSPDGSLITANNSVKYAFEGKAPTEKDFTTQLHEKVPDRYITQTLYEQKALDADATLYMSWAEESCTLFKVVPDEAVCETIATGIEELYLTEQPKRPTRLTSKSKNIKNDLSEVGRKCIFLGEFPSVMGVINDSVIDYDSDTPYLVPEPKDVHVSTFTYDELQRHLLLCEEIINETYEVQRVMASQVVVYLLADVDRFWKDEQPHAIPVLYFYRGYSLSMDIARTITESCKEKCREHGLDVVACAADGEFTPLIVRGRAGNPLTQHQLSKDTWKEVCKLTKADILKLLLEETVSNEITMLNTEMSVQVLHVCSNAGSLGRICTPERGWWHPQVCATTVIESNYVDTIIEESGVESENMSTIVELPDTMDSDANEPAADINIDVGPQIETADNNSGVTIEPPVKFSEIAVALNNLNTDKWSKKTEADITMYFENADTLQKFNVKELIEITKCLNNGMEDRCRLKTSGLRKHHLVNQISDILCDGSKVTERLVNKKRKVQPLRNLAQRYIMKKSYPKKVLNIAYCNFIWPNRLHQWKRNARINDTINIHGVDEDFKPYYVPDNSEHGDFEVFVYDKTHLGSNLRKCICLNRVKGVSKDAWKRVSEQNVKVLNPMLLEVTEEGKIIDQMKERLARNMVCEDVEKQMRLNGDTLEADFCNIVREGLYSADDMPGIPAIDRCHKRLRLIKWLDDGTDFGNFPPYGASIKGLSTILYEGLRSSNEAKLYLYALVKKGTYNVRAPNTLCSESFFSTMQEMDPWGQGVLTSDGVEKHISDFTTITALKMKDDRSFCMRTKTDTAYPTQTMMPAPGDMTAPVTELPACECRANRYIRCIVPKDHFFDTEARARRSKKNKPYTFPDINEPARGEQPVRMQYGYRINESKVLPSKRLGVDVNILHK